MLCGLNCAVQSSVCSTSSSVQNCLKCAVRPKLCSTISVCSTSSSVQNCLKCAVCPKVCSTIISVQYGLKCAVQSSVCTVQYGLRVQYNTQYSEQCAAQVHKQCTLQPRSARQPGSITARSQVLCQLLPQSGSGQLCREPLSVKCRRTYSPSKWNYDTLKLYI